MELDRSAGLTFDEPSHTYTMDGRRAPGIHEILELGGLIDPFRDEAAMIRGQQIHKAIELDFLGILDYEDFRTNFPDQVGLLESSRRAREYLQVNEVEILCGHRDLWYVTRVDAAGVLQGNPSTFNWKSGDELKWYCVQAAAEFLAYFDDDHLQLDGPKGRADVFLANDGTFNPLHQVRSYTDQEDFRQWERCCGTADWKVKRGYGRPKPIVRHAKPKQSAAPAPPPKSAMFDRKSEGPPRRAGMFG